MSVKVLLNKKLERWQKRRSPPQSDVTLNQRNTYIFPTRYGFLMALMILLMGIGATNYQNNLIFFATFFALTIGLLSIVLTFNNLVALRFSPHEPEAVFAGSKVKVPISVTSEKAHNAVSLSFKHGPAQSFDVLPNTETRIVLVTQCTKRGHNTLPKVKVSSIFPFGFLQVWSWLFFSMDYLAYPKPIAPSFGATTGHQQDEHSNDFQSGTEDFYGLKKYEAGESLSRIHWKSYARGKGLQTKEFVDYLSDPNVFDYSQFEQVEHELRLSYLSYLIKQAAENNEVFGLKLPDIYIVPSKGEKHMHECLKALALAPTQYEGI
ncbi:MAG: DUF58 domain-containing protein [Gammaproteobacteria bacterium]|nr:DUF58 domain-containing protein [Gammaproteobacteria bacterium]